MARTIGPSSVPIAQACVIFSDNSLNSVPTFTQQKQLYRNLENKPLPLYWKPIAKSDSEATSIRLILSLEMGDAGELNERHRANASHGKTSPASGMQNNICLQRYHCTQNA
jgi:hypothetical protein